MPGPGVLLPIFALAAVFAVSGVAKARDRHTAAAGFRALGLPQWTVGLPGPELVAAVEILVAAGLVSASGWLFTLSAGIAVALCAAYLALVVAALRRPDPVSCGCFGDVLDDAVSGWTALRNAALLGCAGTALYAAATGASTPALVRTATVGDWASLGAAVLVVGLGMSLAASGAGRSATAPPLSTATDASELDYLRLPIPYGVLLTEDGEQIVLREWAARQARLLLFLNPTCGSCVRVAELVPTWAESLSPQVGVHVVRWGPSGQERAEPGTLLDPQGHLARAVEASGTPAAVLLGADGLLAGGPVIGADAVTDFVDEVATQLSGG